MNGITPLGRDRHGVSIYAGDLVSVISFTGTPMEATAVEAHVVLDSDLNPTDSRTLIVRLDDGITTMRDWGSVTLIEGRVAL